MSRVADAVATVLEVTDGRLAMTADGEADVYVDTPDFRPLTEAEVHATVRLEGDDAHARVDLTAAQLDALADAIHHAQEADR